MREKKKIKSESINMNKRTELMQNKTKYIYIYIIKKERTSHDDTSVLILSDGHAVHLNYHLTCLI